MGPAAFIGIGALATLITAVGTIMVALGALATHFPKMEEFLNKGLPLLEKIGYGLGSFFGNIVGGFSAGVSSGLPEIASNLTAFMMGIQGFVIGARNIGEDSLTGVKNLAQMFALLAGANIVEGISKWLTGESSMETFSTGLNSFADGIVSFSNKVKGNINEESVMAAANAGKLLAEMQKMIQGTGGIFQFFTGEKDLASFGTQLVAFGDAIVKFSNKVSGNIDENSIVAAANAGKLMAEMQSKIVPSGGVLQFFTGEKDFANFGVQLVAFGSAISAFSTSVSAGINEEAVTAAANAGTIMTTLQSKLVSSGGVIQFFTGEKDMATFGTQLVSFGDAIVKFSNKVSEGVNEEAITAAANAGTLMATLQSKVVPSYGVIDLFTGSQDLITFGTQIVAFGKAISSFSKSVTGENAIDEGAVTAAANAGKVMASLQDAIPEDGWFDGEVSIDDFGKKIKRFGTYIADYSKEVSEINVEAISNSATQAKKLVGIAQSVVNLDVDGIDKFKSVKTIGDGIKGYADKVSGIDSGSVSSSIGAIRSLISVINSMSSIDTSGVSSFMVAINNLSKVQIDGVIQAFSGASAKLLNVGGNLIESVANGMRSKQGLLINSTTSIINFMVTSFKSKASVFQSTGSLLMSRFVSGIRSQNPSVMSAATASLSAATNSMRGYYGSFYSAGAYVASGFAAGIRANISSAAAAAASMASAASAAATANLKINSPSKVFRNIGSSVPEGFAKGIGMFGKMIDKSTSSMTNLAVDGAESAINKINDILNIDINMQPTIRPVLDLSDVKSGVGGISKLFRNGSTIGVSANVNRVSSMMNIRSQNGGTNDVVYAINKLRKDLGNVGHNTYNVNGITYDDGSNVASAVETLIRAAILERRS